LNPRERRRSLGAEFPQHRRRSFRVNLEGRSFLRKGATTAIEILSPQLEALIRERMERGEFDTVEDMLFYALTNESLLEKRYSELLLLKKMYREVLEEKSGEPRTGVLLIRALQSSPYRELDIEPVRFPFQPPARDVTL
jgi:hypothetical protein